MSGIYLFLVDNSNFKFEQIVEVDGIYLIEDPLPSILYTYDYRWFGYLGMETTMVWVSEASVGAIHVGGESKPS